MTGPEAKQLLEKYNQGNCTAEEKALVERWYLIGVIQTSFTRRSGSGRFHR
jgi:hypothetical protein